MAALLDRIYREYGRLDVVVHGAGIIDDRTIPNKDESSFDRVFDTKTISAAILARHLRPEGLRALVFYASVAGRIGNPGQADYAAANEVLNRLAWELDRQWPSTQVDSVNWGPWEGSGMATEEVARGFRDRGILPVPRDAGRRWLLEALTHGPKGQVEHIVGQGPWASLEESEPPATVQHGAAAPPSMPLVRDRHSLDSAGAVTMEHVFSLATDPYLTDHRLDEVPVLPAAVVLEWVAEFVQSAWPGWMLTSVRNLRVLKGLTLEGRDAIRVVFRARASTHTDSDSLRVGVEVLDIANQVTCYTATAILETTTLGAATAPPLVSLPQGSGLDATTVYRDYLFHAGRFRLLTAVESLTEAGVDAQARASAPPIFLKNSDSLPAVNGHLGEWIFDPGLVDTAPQLAIVWSRVMHNTTALPHRIGVATRFGAGPIEGPVRVSLRVKPSSGPHSVIYDAFCCGRDGSVRLHLEDVESACTAALNRVAAQAR